MDLVSKQREERKQRILEVGRRQIAAHGFDGVTMRELAEESLVSVPTLYNLFGGKNELLSAVVESYFERLLGSALRRPTGEGNARYARSLMTFSLGTTDSSPVLEFVARELADEFSLALEQMQGRRQLVTWVDREALAERLASLLLMVTFEWGNRHLTDEALEAAMLFGAASMLLGYGRGKAASELETAVREHQGAAVIPRDHARKAQRPTGTGES
jgi:AcrR family transcriptional regulator